MNSDEVKGYLIIILAVLSWSFSEIIVKIVQGKVGPVTLSFFRFFIGGLFLLFILLIKRDLSGIIKMIKENLPLIILSSCFALGISNVIYFIGVTNTRANIAATIYTSYPIWITIYSIFILNEKTNLRLKFIGIIIGFIGVAILMTNFNLLEFANSEYFIGNLLVLLGSIIWAFYSVLGKVIQLNEPEIENNAIKFSMISMFFATIPILIFLPFSSESNIIIKVDIEVWFWIIFMGIISTGVGLYLLFAGVKYIEVSKAFSLAFLKPIFAMLLAYILISEEPTIALYISIMLVTISIILINQKRRKIELEK
ncbi:MAG: DMT family transporter [Promethearchaeota archaeon]